MKAQRFKFLTTLSISAVLTVLLATGCGKGNNAPVPAPAPLPTTTLPGYGGGVGCASVGGVGSLSSNNQPFYANLRGQYGSTNGLSLNLYWAQQFVADRFSQNIVGTGNFNFTDMQRLSPYPMPAQSSNLCLSSASVGTSGSTPGVFYPGQNQVTLTLRGAMQVPLYSPYGSFPGGTYSPQVQYGQELVVMRIGQACPAYLYEGRLYGCVEVSIGSSGNYTLQYQAQ